MIDHQVIELLWIILWIVVILIPLFVLVLYLTMFERKLISYMQGRIGPNRVGFMGYLQPFADTLKLLHKELIFPKQSNFYLFLLAPMLSVAPALVAWSVIPFAKNWVLANVNAGVLFLFAVTSLGGYGILVAGWSSNSKYAFFGAMRSAAQVISYEIALGFSLVGVLLLANSMNLSTVIERQSGGLWHWYWIPLLPLFLIFWISSLAETNRAPFDVAEGESEIVAGFHVEYAGMGFALFFLAEYANMILVSAVSSILFFGGYLSVFQGIPVLDKAFAWVPGIVWLLLKMSFFIYLYFWLRATLPRYRYDQIMRLGWKVLIPFSILWVMVVATCVGLNITIWVH